MSDTRLILHVKGTTSETSELPKDVVRSAISEGKITHSQLIWSTADNAWKQVREWPDLLPPIEQLILHVKGTEAETRQLPKPEVRAGISRGQITHSQLIWSAHDNSWKQVRELPELLPSQKLAPAPAPTSTLPHIAQPVVPETPSGPVPHIAVAAAGVPHVKVPVALTGSGPTPKIVPKVKVAAASAAPQAKVPTVAATPHAKVPTVAAIPHAKVPTVAATPHAKVPTVAAIPHAKVPTVAATPHAKVPTVAAIPHAKVPTVATPPQARVPTVAAATPKPQKPKVAGAAATAAAREAALAPGRFSAALEVEHDDHFHPFKWICIGLGIFVVLVLGINYLLVDRPLTAKFSSASDVKITVFAHFGAFMQPNVMVIHIPPSTKITEDNLPDILIALARSSPGNPITGNLFARVAITSGWMAQYSFSRDSWKELGDQDEATIAQRKEFLLGQMDDAAGNSIMGESTLNEVTQKLRREQAWKKFVGNFAR